MNFPLFFVKRHTLTYRLKNDQCGKKRLLPAGLVICARAKGSACSIIRPSAVHENELYEAWIFTIG